VTECTKCGKANDDKWPDGDDGGLCQICWEAYCDKEWWDRIEAIDRLTGGEW